LPPKPGGNHIEHLYSNSGALNRVPATIFAVTHGLLPEEEIEAAEATSIGEK
jgi:hypothetical protein